MATLTVVTASRDGVDIAGAAAAGGGDAFANTGYEVVLIKNGDGSDHTVTFVTQQTVDGQAVADKAVVLTAGHTYAIGPFPTGIYNDANSLVQMTYTAVTSVTVKVVKVAPA